MVLETLLMMQSYQEFQLQQNEPVHNPMYQASDYGEGYSNEQQRRLPIFQALAETRTPHQLSPAVPQMVDHPAMQSPGFGAARSSNFGTALFFDTLTAVLVPGT